MLKTKLRTIVGILVLLPGGSALLWNHVDVTHENKANINPAVFQEFQRIEEEVWKRYSAFNDDGKRVPEQWLTKRELWVHYESQKCMAVGMDWPDTFCDPGEYYDSLTRLEYPLPLFFKKGYEPRTPFWKFWK